MDCVFCKIVRGEIDSHRVAETERTLAFRDLNPQAPHHILVIPKRHIATVNDLRAEDAALTGDLVLTAQQVARELGVAEAGYRLVLNCNEAAGQSVFHIHLHLLAGRRLHWPPG